MSKINVISAGAADAPSIPTASAFFDLMNSIEEFQDTHSEVLSFEQYAALDEIATTLRAFGNLRSVRSVAEYLVFCLHDAENQLERYRSLFKPST